MSTKWTGTGADEKAMAQEVASQINEAIASGQQPAPGPGVSQGGTTGGTKMTPSTSHGGTRMTP